MDLLLQLLYNEGVIGIYLTINSKINIKHLYCKKKNIAVNTLEAINFEDINELN
jgi:hypothetical protein